MKPLIGISGRTRVLDGSMGLIPHHMAAHGYVQAVREAGGIPVILPPVDADAAVAAAARCDGLVLTGGEDLDPARHGRDHHVSVTAVDAQRDRSDLALALYAYDRRQPLLAVCRGLQVLNVALGGDLLVHIPAEIPGASVHRLPETGAVPEHPIRVEAGSRLAAAVGATRVVVNSSHHQAVRELGKGLTAVAWSDDGVIEAIEPEAGWDCLAVQWHPEHRPPDNAASRGPFTALCHTAGAGR